jgi:hypothetical protein
MEIDLCEGSRWDFSDLSETVSITTTSEEDRQMTELTRSATA